MGAHDTAIWMLNTGLSAESRPDPAAQLALTACGLSYSHASQAIQIVRRRQLSQARNRNTTKTALGSAAPVVPRDGGVVTRSLSGMRRIVR